MTQSGTLTVKLSPGTPDSSVSVANALATNRAFARFLDSPEGREWRQWALRDSFVSYFSLDAETEKCEQRMGELAMEWLEKNDLGTITDEDFATAAQELEFQPRGDYP